MLPSSKKLRFVKKNNKKKKTREEKSLINKLLEKVCISKTLSLMISKMCLPFKSSVNE